MVVIENKTFDEIALGQSAELQRTLTNDDIRLFGVLSGGLADLASGWLHRLST